ncbi:MAG: MFS transporter [Anaerolineales bacterium]|nr:MFS transporter [Anaerolineales bacterium]
MTSISPYIETIAQDLNVSYSKAANLSTAFLMTAGIVCMLGGPIVDRFGTMTFLIGGSLCAGLGASLMPVAGSNYNVVFFLRVLQGVSYGGMCTMGPTVALWFYPRERGTVAGTLGVMAYLGGVFSMMVGPALYEMVGGWQQMSAAFSLVIWVVLFALIWFTWKFKSNAYEARTRKRSQLNTSKEGFGLILSNPLFWIGTVLVVLVQWGHLSLNNLGPSYIAGSAGLGLEPAVAGRLSTVIMVFMGVGPLIVGAGLLRILDSNYERVLTILFIVGALSLYSIVAPAIIVNRFIFIIALAIASAATASVLPMLAPYAADIFPHSVVGRVTGLWVGVGTLSGGMTVSFSGWLLAQSGSYSIVYMAAAAAAAVGFFLTLFLIKLKNIRVQFRADAY